jgi:hypothetical protein
MHLVIDGYNLLYAGRLISRMNAIELQRERDRLILLLSDYRKRKQGNITVVFDGWETGWSTEQRELKRGIEVVFSRLGERADDVIKRMVREKGSGAVVVSSDREIARHGERMAVAVIASEQFLERLEGPAGMIEKDLGPEDDEERSPKQKGPSRTLSKKEKRRRTALKKL